MNCSNNMSYCENVYNKKTYLKNESLMALSNGYIGIRGSFIEGNNNYGHCGTYINGLYEYHAVEYGEKFSGYPEDSQALVNLPNPLWVRISMGNDNLDMNISEILEHKRILELSEGLLTRELLWRGKDNSHIKITTKRFVSSAIKNLACMQCEIEILSGENELCIESGIDLKTANISRDDDPRIGVNFDKPPVNIQLKSVADDLIMIKGSITRSAIPFIMGIHNEVQCNALLTKEESLDVNRLSEIFKCDAKQGTKIILNKYIWMNQCEDENSTFDNIESLNAYVRKGYVELLNDHRSIWVSRWSSMCIEITGDDLLDASLNLNMFHLIQNVGKDGKTNIPAKGLTGEGYEGHYFWDTEIYMFPFFLHTNPDIAKSLIMFRYHTKEQARARAAALGHHKGILYPWRTINGDECSTYFPAGTAQYHINADIAYAIKQYYYATDDRAFLLDYGIELLLEMTELWMDLGTYNRNGDFVINCVTGPDEYTCMVNNNAYTNMMVADTFSFISELIDSLSVNEFNDLSSTVKELVERFDGKAVSDAGRSMFFEIDSESGVLAQDDSFLSKPKWKINETPSNHFPLLLHYHPMTLYRYQVCKQADVVLGHVLLPERFSIEQKEKDYDYYKQITTHDSSLSACIYGISAAELERIDESYELYMKTAMTDLVDEHGNTKDGIHAANMAGSWLGLVYGFAGFRLTKEKVIFNPRIPKNWEAYEFRIRIKGRLVSVKVGHDKSRYRILSGSAMTICHKGTELHLEPAKGLDIERICNYG